MSAVARNTAPERLEAPPAVPDSTGYRRLDTVDRYDAKTLNKFCQSSQCNTESSTRLANLAVLQSLITAIPIAVVDFVALYATILVTTGAIERLLGISTQQVENQTAFFVSLVILPVAHLAGLYPGIGQCAIVEFRQIARSLFVSLAVLAGIGWFCFPDQWAFYWLAAPIAFCVALPVLVAARSFVRKIVKNFGWWGVPTFILAEREYGVGIHRRLESNGVQGFRPVGVLLHPDELWNDLRSSDDGIPYFDIRRANELAIEFGVTYVIVSSRSKLETTAELDASIAVIPNRVLLSSDEVDMGIWDHVYCVGSICGLGLSGGHPNQFTLIVKRMLDVFLAGSTILLGAPIWLFLCLLLRLSSPGPIFYGQRRVGRDGLAFTAWKIRTMAIDADRMLEDYLVKHPAARTEWLETHKLAKDPRITPIGRFLRATSLDELPQLWNVIKGDMSLVGPRPIVDSPNYDQSYITDYPAEFEVYKSVRPGLTGLWQVRCRNRSVYEMRIYYDMYYVRHWSVWLDLYLILRTVKTILLGEGK